MISQRSDYDYVTIPGAIKINGEILPLRPEASRHDLRGEDPAFLVEAQAERRAAWANADPGTTDMTTEIRADRLRSVANSIRTDVEDGRFIRPWPDGPVYDIKTLDLATALNQKYTVSDLVSSPDDFLRGHPLDHSNVMKLFHDTSLLRTPNLYFPNGPYFGSSVSFTYAYTHGEAGGANEDTWEAYGTTIYDYRCSSYEMSDWDGMYWYGQWKEATATGGNLSFSIGDVRKKYIRPVTRAICICSVTDHWTDWDDSHDSGSEEYAAFSCSCAYSDGTVTLDLASLVSGAKSLLSHYGFAKRWKAINGSQTAQVNLVSILPVVEMGDRCRW